MAPTKVILLSCGSYNPPTNMHLRMFEIARDHLHKMGTHVVVGGVISPVHDAYGKKELVSASHRCAMLRLALQNNDWIRLSDWETKREEWTKTKVTIQHHQNLLNSWIFDTNDVKHHSEIEDMDWIPDKIKNSSATEQTPIQVKLLCGADLLESFGTPGLWAEEDIDAIVGQHGLVVVTREGSNPNKFIYDSDLLSKYIHNILIVTEWITNEISSTKIRRALRRGESVRYLLHDSVLDYVYKHEIYNARRTAGIKLGLSTNNAHNNYLNVDSKYDNGFLTPSPSDITMETPSPVEIISIDIPDSIILKKNLLNSSPFGSSTKLPIGQVDDNDLMREKFIGVMSENGNKLLNNMKSVYPGQAKQIIATETGESHILDEVGSIPDRNIPLTIQNDCDNKSLAHLDKDYALINLESKDSELMIHDKKNFLELNCENPENDSSPLNDPGEKITYESESVGVNDLYQISESPVDEKESGKTKDTFLSEKQDEEDQKVPKKENPVEEVAIMEENLIKNFIPDEINSEEQIGGSSVNKEALEIDGKYLKSLVNSRKSPKKCKTKSEKTTCKEQPPIIASEVLAFCEIPASEIAKTDSLGEKEESKTKEDGFTQCDKIDSVNSESQTDLNFVTDEKSARFGSRRTSKASLRASESATKPFIIQGSLDSVKFSLPMEKSGLVGLDSAAKKSKSFESIKYDSSRSISYKSFEISYSDTLKPKSDSTSRLVTANFCTECCYANDSFLPDASLNQETFYTVQSNQSSPVEGDSTECDICSACNLDSTDILDSKSLNIQQDKCDLCEICGDLNADFEGDLVMPCAESELRYSSAIGDDSGVTLFPDGGESDNDRFEIENCGLETEASVKKYEEREGEDSFEPCVNIEEGDNDDDFEIENCGLDNNVKNIARDTSKLRLQLVQKNQSEGWRANNIGVYSSSDNFNKNSKLSLAKFLPNGSRRERKIVRKGSFIISESSPKLFQDKRRYSSVDNLQQPKQIVRLSERGFQRSRSSKLVASADNIQSTNTHARYGRVKKLQKSVNDIDTLEENFVDSTKSGEYTLSENDLARSNEGSNIRANIKIRDSDMVKMILTKHGIKIISEKETAL